MRGLPLGMRRGFDWTPAAISKLLALYGRGLPIWEIAAAVGCSKTAAAHHLHVIRIKALNNRALSEVYWQADRRRQRCTKRNRGGRPKGVPNPNAGGHSVRTAGKIAKGRRVGTTLMLQAEVSFDDETFAEIAARAMAKEKSFSSEVRDLVEIGLEQLKLEGKSHAV